jgi:hypothetical protein
VLLMAALMVLLSWACVIWSLNTLRWRLDQPAGQAVLVIGALLVLRPTLIVLGLDSPFPDEFFLGRDLGRLIVETQVAVVLWIVVFTLFARAFRPSGAAAIAALRTPSDDQLARVLPALAVGAAALVLPLWLRYGGISGLTTAAKGKTLGEGMRIVRTPAALIAYLGAALAVSRDALTGTRRWWRRGWAAYVVGAVVSYSFGARDAAVYPLLFPLIATMSRDRRMTARNIRKVVRRGPALALGAVLLLLLAFGLRAYRDVTVAGRVQSSVSGQPVVRQLAVATNHTRYDAMMLVVADTPSEFSSGGARVLLGSLGAAIPSVLRRTPNTFVVPALVVAQHYVPTRKNGWPLTPPGDWYFALGLAGVAFGAGLSGVVAARLGGWQQRQRRGSKAAANALVVLWGTTVASGGLGLATPARIVALVVPLLLVLVVVKRVAHANRVAAVVVAPKVRA